MGQTGENVVEVLQKGVAILGILAEAPAGLTLAELTAASGQAKSSAHRLLRTWEALGFVERSRGGGYQLGLAALELARKMGRRSRLVEVSRQTLLQIQRVTGESVYLAVYRSGRVVLIDAIEGVHPLRVVVDLGEQCYLHASAQGRAIAAYLDPEALAAILASTGLERITPKTNTDPAALEQSLDECRRLGYSINWEETVEGSVCIGVPCFAGADGPVIASIGISVPVSRANETHRALCTETAVAAARNLSRALIDIPAEPEARPATHK